MAQRTGGKKTAAAKRNAAVRKTAKNKPAEPVKNAAQTAENSIAVNIAPFILIIFSVYILVTFFINGDNATENVGGVGIFIKNAFYGLFGSVAVLVPLCTASAAFFLKKDIKNGFLKYRLIFSVICIALYASMFHLGMGSEESAKIGYNLSEIFEKGKNSVGGGVFGGYIAETLRRIVGIIGAWIFCVSLSVVFSSFLFGYTPAEIVKLIIRLIKGFKTSKRGFEFDTAENIPQNGLKTKPARDKIPPRANTARKNSPLDVPIDSPKNEKKSNTDDIYIGDNPFANSFTEEAERVKQAEQTENPSQISYETPLMVASGELIEANGLAEGDVSIDIEGDESFADFTQNEPGEIKIIESAPQTREDEPDIAENTSKFTDENFHADKKEYKLPPISYLNKDTNTANVDISEELQTTATKLTDTLASFGVRTKIYGYSRGPSITRYEISPDSGVKVNSIVNLVTDISLNLAAEVRIEAPIPGKAAIGVEVPNKNREIVHLRDLLESPKFTNAESKITIALGKDVAGNPMYSDIAKMPHLLIAGATGSGKSIYINVIIASILYKATPNEVKLILVDPKKVELNMYNGIPHLLVPVVSDPKKAAGALSWAVNEMENRYMLIEEKGVRNLKAYNEAVENDPEAGPLPQIVIIIDELADLMLTAPADVEQSVNRLAAKARAAGIHLIVGTQRPSVDVITGLIKANIPTRIAFTVVSQIDSRTIINMAGAEKLIGLGDMLYVPTGTKPIRVQGAFISDSETLGIIEFWKKQSDGSYDENIISEIDQEAARCNTKGAKIKDKDEDETNADDEFKKDSALKSAIELAIDMGTVSTSLLQRKLNLGYGRAARIVDTMEKMNVISGFEGSKPRKVLITREDFIAMTMHSE